MKCQRWWATNRKSWYHISPSGLEAVYGHGLRGLESIILVLYSMSAGLRIYFGRRLKAVVRTQPLKLMRLWDYEPQLRGWHTYSNNKWAGPAWTLSEPRELRQSRARRGPHVAHRWHTRGWRRHDEGPGRAPLIPGFSYVYWPKGSFIFVCSDLCVIDWTVEKWSFVYFI